ncbi:hypothetical protein [Salinibaculum rarum]|uniref:hypothetical protein n=1 Tax=Salinibaculum rarum TaxID=3058903 RepID=UPI00265F5A4F|nr:hypothetical protein [Salinibaculum sp. KK48]
MPRTHPTTTITHDGKSYTINFEWALECKHCGHITRTTSEQDRVTCGNCNRKNTRDQIAGKYFEEYLKYSLFSGDEDTVNTVTETLQAKAEKYEAMEANDWVFDCTTASSHIAMHKGDVPAQEITA